MTNGRRESWTQWELGPCEWKEQTGMVPRTRTPITADPFVCSGQPVITGTAIPAYRVLELLREGLSLDEVVERFGGAITRSQARACVEYAIANLRQTVAYAA